MKNEDILAERGGRQWPIASSKGHALMMSRRLFFEENVAQMLTTSFGKQTFMCLT